MIESSNIDFINKFLGILYAKYRNMKYGLSLPAKEPPYNAEDGGVPPDMMDGPIEDDWVKWKMLPTSITEGDVLELEKEFNIKFPGLFRAYLLANYHLFDQINEGKALIMLPTLPSDAPFKPIRNELSGWQPLIDAEYIPFAEYEDCQGPICFDGRFINSDDTQIVWFDHEILISIGEENCRSREILKKHAQPLYAGFRELILDQFQ